MLAFSKEWIEALAEELKNDDEYQQAAVGFDSRFQFVVEPVPAKGVTERYAVGLKAPQCDEVWEGIRKDVDYTLSGPYSIFVEILNGNIGATKAMVTRKLRLKGNMTNLLKYKRAIDLFVAALGKVETDFEGEFATS
jgi:putative sterol carrier protein